MSRSWSTRLAAASPHRAEVGAIAPCQPITVDRHLDAAAAPPRYARVRWAAVSTAAMFSPLFCNVRHLCRRPPEFQAHRKHSPILIRIRSLRKWRFLSSLAWFVRRLCARVGGWLPPPVRCMRRPRMSPWSARWAKSSDRPHTARRHGAGCGQPGSVPARCQTDAIHDWILATAGGGVKGNRRWR